MAPPSRPRFDPTWNYGHVFIAIGMIVGWIGGAVVLHGGLVRTLTELTLRMNVIETALPAIQRSGEQARINAQTLQELRAQTESMQVTNAKLLEQLTGLRVDFGRLQGQLEPLKAK